MLSEEPQIVLPWLTTNAAPVIERILDSIGPYARQRPDDGTRAINPKIIVEWQTRLVISLVITPSVITNLDEPRKLRRYVSDLLDAGLTPAAAVAGTS